MHSASVLLALASLGVIAHPSLHRQHAHHSKRTLAGPPQLLKAWNSEGIHHEEYVVYDTVVLPAGQSPPEQPAAPVVSQQPAAPVVSQSPPPPTSVAAPPAVTSVAAARAPETEHPEPAAPSATLKGVSNALCAIESVVGGDASAWASNPCSGGKSILDSFNKLRASWIPSLAGSPYTWDATLAANARLTAVSPVSVGANGQTINEGGATQMHHNLFDGSMAQVIASGDGTTMSGGLTPFEQAAKMWLCEEPQGSIGCTGDGGADKDHAEIIKSTTYTKVGCYYMDATGPASWKGEWTCDFA